MKKALITGITGQDGSYLAELLLEKDYEVYGLMRRGSLPTTARIDHLQDALDSGKLYFHQGELSDSLSLVRLISEIKPDEIYNLGAQSHVHVSFYTPEYTANADGIGATRILEAIRIAGLEKKTKFYQASTSEMFGSSKPPQNEETPFAPRNPYGIAKLYAHWITKMYREGYGMFACSGILFNHESPRRGETFVTRKITRGAGRIKLGLQDKIVLGNLDAKRDWGHARDYVRAMHLMLQADKPDDYVVAMGEQYPVREFCDIAFKEVGIELDWQGNGKDERGVDKESGSVLVEVSAEYFRPAEVDSLQGDASKIREELGWKPETSFEELVKEMVKSDILVAEQEANIKKND